MEKSEEIVLRLKPEARKLLNEICARAMLRKHKKIAVENEKSGKQNVVGQ